MKLLAFTFPGGEIAPVGGIPSGGADALAKIIRWGITTLLIAVTLLAIVFLMWGGVSWITSGGDKTKVEAARKKLTYAVLGLILAFVSYFIIGLIGNFFGVRLLNIPTPTDPPTHCVPSGTHICPS